MEQNKEPRNSLIRIWTIDFQQRRPDNSMRERIIFLTNGVGTGYLYGKNELRPLPDIDINLK